MFFCWFIQRFMRLFTYKRIIQKKLNVNAIVYLSLPLMVFWLNGCETDKEKLANYTPTAYLKMIVYNQSIEAKEHKSSKGIKMYPDANYWHVNFIQSISNIDYDIVFQLKNEFKEGDTLHSLSNGIILNYYEPGGKLSTDSIRDTFTLTVKTWRDDNVELEFSGNLRQFGGIEIPCEGTIKTVIDHNNNPAKYSTIRSYDDHNDDNIITISYGSQREIILQGKLNSIYGGLTDKFIISYDNAKYKYSFNYFNLARTSCANLVNSDGTLIQRIDNNQYIDNITSKETRQVVIQQGNYWLGGDGGAYELSIESIE